MANQTSPRDFCQWFKGVLDVTNGNVSPEQLKMIKERLNSVFTHEEDKPKQQGPLGNLPDGARC